MGQKKFDKELAKVNDVTDNITDNAKEHNLTESMYNAIGELFESQKKYYHLIEKEIPDEDATGKSVRLDYLLKFSTSMGYIAQVHAGLAKAYSHEKRLGDIESRLHNIPTDILEKYLK